MKVETDAIAASPIGRVMIINDNVCLTVGFFFGGGGSVTP